MKEIGLPQTFICLTIDCPIQEFEGQFTKGLFSYAKPPRCPECHRPSETIKGKGNMRTAKTKGHKRYAETI